MRKIKLCASLFAMVLLFSASPVMAQQWVGPNGNDANACSQAAPCATFQRAINVGASIINCLGSGNYGAVTIQTSLTIDCGAGNVGNIVNSIGSGITINTTAPATIILRHLVLTSTSANTLDGISASSFFSGTLIIDDCVIGGYGSTGIIFQPQSGRGLLQISNSQILNNNFGVTVAPHMDQIGSATLNRVEIVGNSQDGLTVDGGGVVAGTMRDSVVSSNGRHGVRGSAVQGVFFTVENSSIVANLNAGITTSTAVSTINVAASTIGGNGTGVLASSGSIISFGDNHISANGVDGNFTSTNALK
jgi:hypothetical protein